MESPIEDIKNKLNKVVKSLPYCLYEIASIDMNDSNEIAVVINDSASINDEGIYKFVMPIKSETISLNIVKQFVRYIKTCLINSYKSKIGSIYIVAKKSELAEKLMYCSKQLFNQTVTPQLLDNDAIVNIDIIEVCNKKQICFEVCKQKVFMDIDSLGYYAWEQFLRKWSIEAISSNATTNQYEFINLPAQLFQNNLKTAKAIASILILQS